MTIIYILFPLKYISYDVVINVCPRKNSYFALYRQKGGIPNRIYAIETRGYVCQII